MSRPNAAGLVVAGHANPNWKGGEVAKSCEVCGGGFTVKPGRAAAKFCSMKCVGASQRGVPRPARAQLQKQCAVCPRSFSVYRSHASRSDCCSRACAGALRARYQSGHGNPNWRGGLSRMPYPWNFGQISKRIIERDGFACQGPTCSKTDPRLTAHHIDYDKDNCADDNLITLCSSCNSKANFGRARWQEIYCAITEARR